MQNKGKVNLKRNITDPSRKKKIIIWCLHRVQKKILTGKKHTTVTVYRNTMSGIEGKTSIRGHLVNFTSWIDQTTSVKHVNTLTWYFRLIMNRKLKHWWSSIPPIQKTWATTSHPNWTHITQEDYDMWLWKTRS